MPLGQVIIVEQPQPELLIESADGLVDRPLISKQNPDSFPAVNHCPRRSACHRCANSCISSRFVYGTFSTNCGGEA